MEKTLSIRNKRVPSRIQIMENAVATVVNTAKPSFLEKAPGVRGLTGEAFRFFPVHHMAGLEHMVGHLGRTNKLADSPFVLPESLFEDATSLSYIRPGTSRTRNTIDQAKPLNLLGLLFAEKRSKSRGRLKTNLQASLLKTT